MSGRVREVGTVAWDSLWNWTMGVWRYACQEAVAVWLVIVTVALAMITYLSIKWQREASMRPVVIFRQDRDGRAALVNVGVGPALNITAWFRRGDDRERRDLDALSPGGSTHLDDWGWHHAPEQVWVRYTNAENVAYFSHLSPSVAPSVMWSLGKGRGPQLPPGGWPGVPMKQGLPLVNSGGYVFGRGQGER
jgi:hypothetical protein